MSPTTSYQITFDQLSTLCDTACILDDRNVIPCESLRREIVARLHGMVESVAGPDAVLFYAEGA